MFVLHKARIYFANQNLVSEILWWADPDWTPLPNKDVLSLPSSNTQGTENVSHSWVKIRIERGHSPVAIIANKDLTWGNEYNFYYQSD